MAQSEVSIANAALIRVGADKITALTDSAKGAKLIFEIYDDVLDECLRAHSWNFATKRAVLVPTANTPAWGYLYEFDMPDDIVRLLDSSDDIDYIDPDYVVEGKKILSNNDSISIRYIFREGDISKWDACFCSTFAALLAYRICYAMTQSSEKTKECKEEYKEQLALARSYDGSEGTIRGLQSDAWARARR